MPCTGKIARAEPRPLLPLKALGHVGHYAPAYVAPAKNNSGTWKDFRGSMPFKQGPDTAVLLTDGTVMVHDVCYGQWYRRGVRR